MDNFRASALPGQLAALQREAAQLREALAAQGAADERLAALEAQLVAAKEVRRWG